MSLSSRFSRWPSSGTFWRPSLEHLSANQPSGLCGRISNRLAGAQRRVEYMRMRGPQAKGHAELAVCQVELPLRPEALVENSISENSTSLSTNRYRRWRAQAMQRPDPRFNYPLDRKPAYCAIPNSGLVTPTPTDLEEPLNPTSGSNLSELKKLYVKTPLNINPNSDLSSSPEFFWTGGHVITNSSVAFLPVFPGSTSSLVSPIQPSATDFPAITPITPNDPSDSAPDGNFLLSASSLQAPISLDSGMASLNFRLSDDFVDHNEFVQPSFTSLAYDAAVSNSCSLIGAGTWSALASTHNSPVRGFSRRTGPMSGLASIGSSGPDIDCLMNSRQPATTTKPTDPSGRFAHLHHRAQDPVLSGTSGHWPSDYVASSATSPSFPNSKSSSLSPSAPCRPPSRVSELFSGLKNTLMTSNLQTSASTGNQSSVAGCAEDPGLLELVLSANNFGAIDCSTTASCLKETGSLKFCQGKRISPAASSNVLLLKETWRTPSTLSPGLRKSRSDSGNIDSLHECIWEQNDGCLEVEANSVEEGERRLFSSILSLPCS